MAAPRRPSSPRPSPTAASSKPAADPVSNANSHHERREEPAARAVCATGCNRSTHAECWSSPRRRRPVGPCMPSSGWAGSPAGSSPTGLRPNTPSGLPSGWAASTPPKSWAPPGRRCVKPSPATASACPPATPWPSASAPSPPSASALGSRGTPSLDPVFVALNRGALPARPRSEAELYQWVRREEQYATLGRQRGRAVQRKPRPPIHHSRLGNHPTSRPRPPSGRPTHQPRRPPKPVPAIPGTGDGGRCSLTPPTRPAGQRAAIPRLLSSLMSPGSCPKAPWTAGDRHCALAPSPGILQVYRRDSIRAGAGLC